MDIFLFYFMGELKGKKIFLLHYFFSWHKTQEVQGVKSAGDNVWFESCLQNFVSTLDQI